MKIRFGSKYFFDGDGPVPLALLKQIHREVGEGTFVASTTIPALDELEALGRVVKRASFERIREAPFGWRYSAAGELEQNEHESALLSKVMVLRAEGRSWQFCAKALKEGGFHEVDPAWLCRSLIRHEKLLRERGLLGETTSFAHLMQKKIPYGFQIDPSGSMVRNEDEQRVVARIAALRTGGYSLAEISGILRHDGVKTRRGKLPTVNWISAIQRSTETLGTNVMT